MASWGRAYWFIQIPGWVLFGYLVYAQAIPAFDYELGVQMGTQEPKELITEVGKAFWVGFAFADLVIYIPLLGIGLFGHLTSKKWTPIVLGAALGITIYWPVVVLAAAIDARNADGWLVDTAPYWTVLPPVALWALWALYYSAVSGVLTNNDAGT